MLVACFHIWFGRVSGGVDVFLALSGYFFIGSLLRHAINSQATHVTFIEALNPWPRLKRLLRRLLPALFTVLIAVAILTVVVLPQTRWLNIGRELRASALYYQNWYLALNSQDYLAASSANSPLQHIWSMSVQGQFFVGMLPIAGVVFALDGVLLGASDAAYLRSAIADLEKRMRTAAADADLERAYRSSVDPRLNYEQSLETAMLIVRKQEQAVATG